MTGGSGCSQFQRLERVKMDAESISIQSKKTLKAFSQFIRCHTFFMLLCIWPLQGSISFCIFIFYIIYYFCSCSNEPTLIVLSLSVVAVLLCIVLPATASDVLRCTGERQSDGQFYFNMTYDLKRVLMTARPNGSSM